MSSHFKPAEDFLRFTTMGARGTASTRDFLNKKHDHCLVELERYAMSNKIWMTKIKKMRVPDLLCLKCGLRVEARTKTNLAAQASHGGKEERAWDAGMAADDLMALIPWDPDAQDVGGNPQFFRYGDLRDAYDHEVTKTERKSQEQGSEMTLTWPTYRVSKDGEVVDCDQATGRVKVQPTDGGSPVYARLHHTVVNKGATAHFYVEVGQQVEAASDLILGVMPNARDLDCSGLNWDYREQLTVDDPIDRYAAVKAAGHAACAADAELLESIQEADPVERIRLEAVASLCRLDPPRHTAKLGELVRQAEDKETEMAMEAVFILAELATDEAAVELTNLIQDRELPGELRPAALWGLAQIRPALHEDLLAYVHDEHDELALHALAALTVLDEDALAEAEEMLARDDREAASAMHLLAGLGRSGGQILIRAAETEGPQRRWGVAGLGLMDREIVLEAADGKLSSRLERDLAPMWTRHDDWLRRREEDLTPLEALRRQSLRY